MDSAFFVTQTYRIEGTSSAQEALDLFLAGSYAPERREVQNSEGEQWRVEGPWDEEIVVPKEPSNRS